LLEKPTGPRVTLEHLLHTAWTHETSP